MIIHNENEKAEWIPSETIPDKVIKELRTKRREKFKFLQEEKEEEE